MAKKNYKKGSATQGKISDLRIRGRINYLTIHLLILNSHLQY